MLMFWNGPEIVWKGLVGRESSVVCGLSVAWSVVCLLCGLSAMCVVCDLWLMIYVRRIRECCVSVSKNSFGSAPFLLYSLAASP